MSPRPPPPPHKRAIALVVSDDATTSPEGFLTVLLDPVLEAALDRLVAILAEKPDVAALGIRVTREAAARSALLKGVEVLSSPVAATAPAPVVAAPVGATMLTATDMLTGAGVGAGAATGAAAQPHSNWMPVAPPTTGVEVELHAWYAARGWRRFQATTPRGPATIYWAPIEIHRPLCASPFDPGVVVVNVDGYGPVHVVPPGWATQHGADAAELKEAGRKPSLQQVAEGDRVGPATVIVGG